VYRIYRKGELVQAQQQDALRALGAEAVEPVDVHACKVGGLVSQPLQVDAAVLALDLLQEGLDPGQINDGDVGQTCRIWNNLSGNLNTVN
jgi:hypothetical protein